jgi:CRP/FNR family transcriptional regulator
MSQFWELKQLDLFGGLEPEQVDQLLDIVTVESFAEGEVIFRPGNASDRIYLLQHGQVKVYVVSRRGQERILHVFFPGDAFGGLLLGVPDEESPWAEAMSDVVVGWMDEAAFRRFVHTFPDPCLDLIRYMAVQHASRVRHLEALLHAKAARRLVLALLDLGERLGQGTAEQFELDPSFTHEDLANMIGAARTTVSELISRLRHNGVLGGQGRRLIVDRPAAERFLQEGQAPG